LIDPSAKSSPQQIVVDLVDGQLLIDGVLVVRVSVEGGDERMLSIPIGQPRTHSLVGMLDLALDDFKQQARKEWERGGER
jgi:hypothetical protein